VFYYWGPTWLVGKYDLYRLEEPAYDKQVWDQMLAAEHPTQATAYPTSEVIVGANADFAKKAPRTVEFLKNYETESALVSRMLAYMRDENATPEKAADHFLATEQQVWTAWVPEEVASKVKASLKP
jgi:glycine betaine/proline transport system substrate-binding protein